MQAIVESRSFRDPDGYIFGSGNRVLRYVRPHAVDDVRALLGSALAAKWMAEGKLVGSRILEHPSGAEVPAECRNRLPDGAVILEHTAIAFPNYPYEWAPGMLYQAGRLTLELAQAGLREGFLLKDATPYNVIYDGCRPTFIDLLSFRRRDPMDPVWPAYAQFLRTFVFPLLAFRYFGLRPDELLLAHRDGLVPERIFALAPAWRLLFPPFLGTVTIPVLLTRRAHGEAPSGYRTRHARDAGEAAFVLEALFARAVRQLDRAGATHGRSGGLQYMDAGCPYNDAEWNRKERFVSAALARCAPRHLLDVGCNTGHFSRMAAKAGARVVAIDRDEAVIDALWRSTRTAAPGVLPLVVDISRPPGACGWQNSESKAFLERARGSFDCVLMLALFHHLVVNERVPIGSLLQLASELTTRWAVVEYVDPQDANFRRIARGRDELHRDVTPEAFEAIARQRFEIADSSAVSPTRRLYLLRKKEG